MYGVYSETPSEDGFFVPEDWRAIHEGLLALP
jgi:hypothetical protein